MVAESTEILAPMLQFGWATACSGVTWAMAARAQVWNGPPEAVSTIFFSRAAQGACRTWKMAECSESTGITLPPASCEAFRSAGPQVTRLSLLARPTTAPVLAAAQAGFRPAAPTKVAMLQTAGRVA